MKIYLSLYKLSSYHDILRPRLGSNLYWAMNFHTIKSLHIYFKCIKNCWATLNFICAEWGEVWPFGKRSGRVSWAAGKGFGSTTPAQGECLQGQKPEQSPPSLKGILNSSVSWIYIIYSPFFLLLLLLLIPKNISLLVQRWLPIESDEMPNMLKNLITKSEAEL